MKASALNSILREVDLNTELYFLNSQRETMGLKCVEVEHPPGDEGEICVNFVLETDEE